MGIGQSVLLSPHVYTDRWSKQICAKLNQNIFGHDTLQITSQITSTFIHLCTAMVWVLVRLHANFLVHAAFQTNPETNNKGASPDAIANPFLSKTIPNKESSRVAAGRGTLWLHASHAYRLFYNNHVTALLSHRHLHGRLDPIIDLDVVAQAMC
jgi:hypothetical protein